MRLGCKQLKKKKLGFPDFFTLLADLILKLIDF